MKYNCINYCAIIIVTCLRNKRQLLNFRSTVPYFLSRLKPRNPAEGITNFCASMFIFLSSTKNFEQSKNIQWHIFARFRQLMIYFVMLKFITFEQFTQHFSNLLIYEHRDSSCCITANRMLSRVIAADQLKPQLISEINLRRIMYNSTYYFNTIHVKKIQTQQEIIKLSNQN